MDQRWGEVRIDGGQVKEKDAYFISFIYVIQQPRYFKKCRGSLNYH